MQESYSVPEIIILEEAEKATLQLLPAKSKEHYEKVLYLNLMNGKKNGE
jgi:hypothetical protein